MEFLDHFRAARRLARFLLSSFDLTVRFDGLEGAISTAGPAVIVMDEPGPVAQAVLTAYYPRPFHAAVRPGLWRRFPLAPFAPRLGILELPIAGGFIAWRTWLRNAAERLHAGGRIAFFLPPHQSDASHPCAELAAAGLLCRMTGCAFIPIASDGCQKALPPGKCLPRVTNIRFLVGKPVFSKTDVALSNRNRDWANMFRTDGEILHERLISTF
ncbi:MAG TPA: hypothetical protein PLP29_12310 [Candidatus Ozemobacteraceae bacterium]|nr:hypothetical protein [Candidatus Ozemobacteraceae bacterium]